jgi:hypothetical protein
MEKLRETTEVDEADQAFAAELLAELGPEGVAAALVRALASDLPAPEDLLDGPAEERSPRAWRLRGRRLVPDQRRTAAGRRPQVAAAADLPDRPRAAQ